MKKKKCKQSDIDDLSSALGLSYIAFSDDGSALSAFTEAAPSEDTSHAIPVKSTENVNKRRGVSSHREKKEKK